MKHPPDSPGTERSGVAGRCLRQEGTAAVRPCGQCCDAARGAAVLSLSPLQSGLAVPRRRQPGSARGAGARGVPPLVILRILLPDVSRRPWTKPLLNQ